MYYFFCLPIILAIYFFWCTTVKNQFLNGGILGFSQKKWGANWFFKPGKKKKTDHIWSQPEKSRDFSISLGSFPPRALSKGVAILTGQFWLPPIAMTPLSPINLSLPLLVLSFSHSLLLSLSRLHCLKSILPRSTMFSGEATGKLAVSHPAPYLVCLSLA